jgi:hypothetical protein
MEYVLSLDLKNILTYIKNILFLRPVLFGKLLIFAQLLKIKAMGKRIKDIVNAINALFSGDDYMRHVANTRSITDSIGEYQGPLKDRENMRNDRRNIYSDMNIAIREGYGKIATQ